MLYNRKNLASPLLVLVVFLSIGAIGLAELDKSKYIGTDEIKAGMKGYCLTCLKGTDVNRFELEVLSVIHNLNPASDTILVRCEGEVFKYAGIIAGCSGSPVYIDGRLAGAMAFGWTGSKDPIYGVTAIEDMLRAGSAESYQKLQGWATSEMSFDFSRPLNFADIENQFKTFLNSRRNSASGFCRLPTPVMVSGLSTSALKELNSVFEPLSLSAVGGAGGFSASGGKTAANPDSKSLKLAPGTSLVVPLVYGDIIVSAGGTVTEVIGDTVYGFGHSLLGYGPIDLPMATGEVHTIIASQDRSFKLISPLQIVGALKVDESSAVCGKIGAQAPMFDMAVSVSRYNDAKTRTFKCKVINHKTLTASLISTIIAESAMFLGDLPPQYNIEYKAQIYPKDSDPIRFSNLAGSNGLANLTTEVGNSVRLLMNNPFKSVQMKSIDVQINIVPKDISAHIWSVEVSDTKVRAGDTLDVRVVLETVREPKRNYDFKVKIPENLSTGNYTFVICGTAEYLRFLDQAAPQRFLAQNFETLNTAMKDLLAIERDKLYCMLLLPSAGIVLEKAELSDLPATKAMVLFDSRRTLAAIPYQNWIENTVKTGLITADRKNIQVSIEN